MNRTYSSEMVSIGARAQLVADVVVIGFCGYENVGQACTRDRDRVYCRDTSSASYREIITNV